jgi:hypothetical protein
VVHFSSVIGSIFRTLHNHPTAFELQIKHFKQFYKLFFCQEYCNYIAKTQHIWFIYYHDKFTETGRKKCCGYHDFVTSCIFKICVLELKMKPETYIIDIGVKLCCQHAHSFFISWGYMYPFTFIFGGPIYPLTLHFGVQRK